MQPALPANIRLSSSASPSRAPSAGASGFNDTKSAAASWAMPVAGHDSERLRAAANRPFEQHAAGRTRVDGADDVAGAIAQPLAVFELAQLVGNADRHVGIRADAKHTAGAQVLRGRKNSVPQIGFGDGAQSRDRAAGGETATLLVRHMRRMHQAPSPVHRRMIQQPLHGPRARPGQALLHLAGLFGGMNVHRARARERHDPRQFLGRDRAQRMRRNPEIRAFERARRSSGSLPSVVRTRRGW